MVKRIIDWSDYLSDLEVVYQQVAKELPSFTFVAGPSRGGLIPAVLFSHRLDLPMVIFNPREVGGLNSKCSGMGLLLDDISDSGQTLLSIQKAHPRVDWVVATPYMKVTTAAPPRYYSKVVKENEWLVFPYELDANFPLTSFSSRLQTPTTQTGPK